MTDLRLSGKLRIFAIISSAIILIGMILGTVFHFTGMGFYNFGGEYESFKSVTISYNYTEFGKQEEVESICKSAFEESGVSVYSKVVGSVTDGNEIIYRFSPSTDGAALDKAVQSINAKMEDYTAEKNENGNIPCISNAVWHDEKAYIGGEHVLAMAAISLAVIVAVQLIYTLLRYKLSAMLTAFTVDLHNIALYAAILAICRIPVTSSVLVFAVLVALVTAIGVTLTLERIKSNAKDSDIATFPRERISDISATQTFKLNISLAAFLVIFTLLGATFYAISALSVIGFVSPVLCALAAFAVCCYGNAFFMPSLYPTIYNLCGKKSAKPSQKKAK